ncbi:Gibberellin-regulated protein 9 [Linum grandiflorum]
MKLFLFLLISVILCFLQASQVQPSESLEHSFPPASSFVVDETNSIDKKHQHQHHVHTKKVMINCGVECKRRCKESSRKNVCHRACKTCCQRCHCVPPGTYGHKSSCPCYARLKTHGGQLKCP